MCHTLLITSRFFRPLLYRLSYSAGVCPPFRPQVRHKKPEASTPPGSSCGGPVPPPLSSTSLLKPPPPPPVPPVIQIRSCSASKSPKQADVNLDIIKRTTLFAGKSGTSSVSLAHQRLHLRPLWLTKMTNRICRVWPAMTVTSLPT